jgi:hypothetical protein
MRHFAQPMDPLCRGKTMCLQRPAPIEAGLKGSTGSKTVLSSPAPPPQFADILHASDTLQLQQTNKTNKQHDQAQGEALQLAQNGTKWLKTAAGTQTASATGGCERTTDVVVKQSSCMHGEKYFFSIAQGKSVRATTANPLLFFVE